ncbi:MAG TPA: isoaspartyl peptidase/L-asparaginase, partial [Isosphaeraceae bacterium]
LKFGVLLLFVWTATLACAADPPPPAGKVVLAIHGGVGTMTRAELTPEVERAYRADLERALRAGKAVLDGGGPGLDAVEAAIRILEDSPRFNAGKGAVFTHEGKNELDASIMDGGTMRAGAVAGVTVVKNPIAAARAVMEKSPHVMFVGPGADAFARSAGLEIVDPAYFRTEERWQQLQKVLEEEKKNAGGQGRRASPDALPLGTVGAVALDRHGHLAAGTSTGGMTNKRFGRVGDSPIIGAGTYAEDASCAVSATGHGEYFIRYAVAHDIAARVKYRGLPVAEAADEVIQTTLRATDAEGGVAEGGVIVLDAQGRFAASFNTDGMYRGLVTSDGKTHIAIFKD